MGPHSNPGGPWQFLRSSSIPGTHSKVRFYGSGTSDFPSPWFLHNLPLVPGLFFQGFLFFFLIILCVWAFTWVYVYVPYVCTWCLRRSEEAIGSPGTLVTHGCEPPSKYWELNPSPAGAASALNLLASSSLHSQVLLTLAILSPPWCSRPHNLFKASYLLCFYGN